MPIPFGWQNPIPGPSHRTGGFGVCPARRGGTNGRIKIMVYFDRSWGQSWRSSTRFALALLIYQGFHCKYRRGCPDLYALQMPYLYEDREHMWRVLDSEIGDELLEKVGDYGFIGLTWFDAGSRSFYTKISL